MIEDYFILVYLCFIIVIQSCVGVGVLVLGTPFLLIMNFNLIEILYILLPLSILTSLVNLLIIKLSNKKGVIINPKGLIKFFYICVPSIIIGLIILKYFQDYINFKILVSMVIVFSILLITLKDKIKFRVNFFRISILFVIGIIHGLTNSGGTLMSLSLSHDNPKIGARNNITLFYLLLAMIQYCITIIIFSELFYFPEIKDFITILVVGLFLGNIIIRYISEMIFKLMINFLAIASSLILLLY